MDDEATLAMPSVPSAWDRPAQDVGDACCELGARYLGFGRAILGGDGPVIVYCCPNHGHRRPVRDRADREMRGWNPR